MAEFNSSTMITASMLRISISFSVRLTSSHNARGPSTANTASSWRNAASCRNAACKPCRGERRAPLSRLRLVGRGVPRGAMPCLLLPQATLGAHGIDLGIGPQAAHVGNAIGHAVESRNCNDVPDVVIIE